MNGYEFIVFVSVGLALIWASGNLGDVSAKAIIRYIKGKK